jgi:predicted HTH transcriptional regulator
LRSRTPGLLPFGLTLEDLPRWISRLRNLVIGRTFHALGLIEQWGSGIQRMTAACRDAAPTLEEIGTRFRVTLWLEQVGATALDKTEQTILATLSDGTGRMTSEVATVIGLTPRATRTPLVRLVERGLVREVGTSPQDPKRRYFISR